ncbi:MAG: peptidase domain-containing ABC transporter [Bacteroidales bacterium]|nr:peptidase domain-containing ABC transporter [Bacteroidales bacterium]
MKKFPLYRQHYQMDCGASCVKMISLFYGKDIPMEQIQDNCNVGTEGVSVKGICKALEDCDFKVIAGKVTLEDLREKALLPCILHWEQNHFVILYKVKKNRNGYRYYIADPAKGYVDYNEKEFSSLWISTNSKGEDKGSAILVEPVPDFLKNTSIDTKKIGQNKRNLSFLWSYFKRFKHNFAFILIGLIIISVVLLITPFLTQSIVDVGISNKSISFVLFILVGQLLLLIGETTIDFLQTRVILHIGARINISLLSDFFIKLMRLPMAFFETRLLGDIIQRIQDHKRIETFLTTSTIGLAFSVLSFIVFGVVILIYDKLIFTTFIVFSILYGVWLYCFVKKRRSLDYKYFDIQSKNQNKTYELVESMEETKLQNAENRKRWEWEDVQVELFNINLSILKLQQTQNAGALLINEIRNIFVTVIAATRVINGEGSLGMMLAIQFIAGQLASPIEKLMNFIYQWQDVSISLDRISDIHNITEPDKNRKYKSLSDYDHTIHVRNISFIYPGIQEKKVLDDISFDIEEGETIAIVGASGSGKTTLLKLLLGFYQPTSGTIEIGDKALKDISTNWWHSQCGVVMQDGFIYADTIAGNIALSENAPDRYYLEYAAQVADIKQFIEALPFKYNTNIGEGGQGLSKGQKQRILIARAVYKDPDYLFLDEATNSLDANTESNIVAELNDFYLGRTVVVIAHRLSTVKNANKIIVLNNGRIVESGTHQELISQKGYYFELVRNQLELGV